MAPEPIDSTHITLSTKRQRRLFPRELHLGPGCSYIVIITHNKDQSVWTTPAGYSGLLRMATPATGVLNAIPKGQPGLGENTYRTSCLPCAGSFYLYTCRIRAGFPYIYHGGAPPYASLWPVFSGHTTLTSSHSNS